MIALIANYICVRIASFVAYFHAAVKQVVILRVLADNQISIGIIAMVAICVVHLRSWWQRLTKRTLGYDYVNAFRLTFAYIGHSVMGWPSRLGFLKVALDKTLWKPLNSSAVTIGSFSDWRMFAAAALAQFRIGLSHISTASIGQVWLGALGCQGPMRSAYCIASSRPE